MNITERIAMEVGNLPEEKAREVLDFVLFLKNDQSPSSIEQPDGEVIHIDTRGWCFDRNEANTRRVG